MEDPKLLDLVEALVVHSDLAGFDPDAVGFDPEDWAELVDWAQDRARHRAHAEEDWAELVDWAQDRAHAEEG